MKKGKKRNRIIEIGVVLIAIAGMVLVASATMDPYGMDGYVKFANETGCPGANITFTNQRTGEIIYYTSITNGAYSQNALNFPSEYADTIVYYTVFDGYTNTTSIVIDAIQGATTKNIYLSEAVGGNASVSITDGSIMFGNLQLSTTQNTVTLGDTQVINTNGADGAQKIEIALTSSTVTGAVNNTVLTFVTGSPGNNELKCEFKGGDVGAYTALTDAYQTFDNSMPASSNANLDIQLTTPSSVSSDSYYDNYQFEIIVRVSLL